MATQAHQKATRDRWCSTGESGSCSFSRWGSCGVPTLKVDATPDRLCQSLVTQYAQVEKIFAGPNSGQACGFQTLSYKEAASYSRSMPTGWPPRDPTAIHLFRALLRECSYLPDPVAKEYFKKHITLRFRRHWRSRTNEACTPPPTDERRVRLLKAAREGLSTLTRANDGQPKVLYKVLSYAYGRSGRRRRDLIDELQIPEVVADSSPTSTDSGFAEVGSNAKLPRLTPRAEAIAKSQANHGVSRDHKGPLRYVRPKIPEKNAWLRAMPQVRVKNLTAKWYANTLERLLPPLPEHEYLLLRRLVSREEPWKAPAFRNRVFDGDINGSQDARKTSPKRDASDRAIPKRKMERLWSRVLALCPILTWNEKKSSWHTTWGAVDRKSEKVPMIATTAPLFEGVDEKGNIAVKDRHEADKAPDKMSRFA